MAIVGSILLNLIGLYLILLVLRALLSLGSVLVRDFHPKGAQLVVAEAVYTLTDPPLKWVGRVIRPVRIGPIGIDASFLVVYVGLTILQRVTAAVFF